MPFLDIRIDPRARDAFVLEVRDDGTEHAIERVFAVNTMEGWVDEYLEERGEDGALVSARRTGKFVVRHVGTGASWPD